MGKILFDIFDEVEKYEKVIALHNAKLTSPPQDSKDSEPPRFGGSG